MRTLAAIVVTAVVLLVLDLAFLGVVARAFYDGALGSLRRDGAYVPAAVAFYAMYVGAIVLHAVLPSATWQVAARRGAALGFVAYATYELTNWAVIRDWPALLVPVDVAWGVVVTALAAAAGSLAAARVGRTS